MLGKLTKHEMIASGRMLIPMYIAFICTSVIGKIFIWLSSKKSFVDSVPITFYKIVNGISSVFTILFILIVIVFLIATILFILIRFYKNYYTDEGYLMFTLPVSSKSLILSKLFSALIYTILSYTIAFGSIALIMYTDETASSFKSICREFTGMVERMAPETNVSVGGFLAELIFLFILLIMCNYLMVYTSTSLGPSILSTHNFIGTIIALIANIAIIVFVFFRFFILNYINYIDTLDLSVWKVNQFIIIGIYAYNIVFCIIYFFTTDHLMRTKTNLE
ncbi:MAG: hypothetical protein EOM05_08445 [Clostridia bacterium]|nr:hypothetical protein [Clostridia bacterium]